MSNLTQFTKKRAKLKTINFTSSGTFEVPPGVETIIVTMIGGGGGYSKDGYYTVYSRIGGGGGGYHFNTPVSVTPGSVLTVTVGSGGTSAYRFYNVYNGSYTQTVWFGTASNGGTSSITNGATELLKAGGGYYGMDVTYQGFAGSMDDAGGGGGGYPNGAGGGAQGNAQAGSTGVTTNASNIYYYSRGTTCNTAVNASAVGMGEFPGATYYAGGSPIPGRYGVGVDGSYSGFSKTSNPVGGNGFVQISYFEV